MEGRGVKGWPVIKPELDEPENESLTGTESVNVAEPDRGMAGQPKGSDRPVKGTDGPVNKDEPVNVIDEPVNGIDESVNEDGPVKDVDGPVMDTAGLVTDSVGPGNKPDVLGLGVAAEAGRSEESSLSPKTSAIVREPIEEADKAGLEPVRAGLESEAGRAPVSWSDLDLSDVDFGRLRSGLPD